MFAPQRLAPIERAPPYPRLRVSECREEIFSMPSESRQGKIESCQREGTEGGVVNTELKPYTYEVTKIELLPNSTADTNNAHGRPLSIESNSIDATKLLQNINKSYDKEVKVLDESGKILSVRQQARR